MDRNRWSSKHTFSHTQSVFTGEKDLVGTSRIERIQLSQENIKTKLSRIRTGFYDSNDAAVLIARGVLGDLGGA